MATAPKPRRGQHQESSQTNALKDFGKIVATLGFNLLMKAYNHVATIRSPGLRLSGTTILAALGIGYLYVLFWTFAAFIYVSLKGIPAQPLPGAEPVLPILFGCLSLVLLAGLGGLLLALFDPERPKRPGPKDATCDQTRARITTHLNDVRGRINTTQVLLSLLDRQKIAATILEVINKIREQQMKCEDGMCMAFRDFETIGSTVGDCRFRALLQAAQDSK